MKMSKNPSIFIVDDDKMLQKALTSEIEKAFAKQNVSVSSFETGERCINALLKKSAVAPMVAIVDYRLDSKFPDAMNGIKTIEMIKKHSPDTEIIMLTGADSVDIAVRAMKHGAHDYIVKSDNIFRKLNMAIYQCIKLQELRRTLIGQRNRSIAVILTVVFILGSIITLQLIRSGSFLMDL